ncbi:MAG: YfhO family protein, partial [Lachnospiraceae bacterium]|nr:YfhO family protein [Lachnospiraceae bacterium]
MTKKKKLLFYALSFLVPFAVGILMFICRKIAPFGQYALTAIDGWGQYFPMLREAERDLYSLNTYSFTGALGFDAFAQSGYYTNSPLWLLLFLLPGKITVWEVDMMVLVRFGLMGLTFFIYAFSRSEKAPVSKLILSAAYALSGYTLTFINQFMWMDAVILLPLVALGIERFYREKKWLLYTASLAVTIWSNFYISYMVCVFAVIWFFKEVLRMGRAQTFQQFLLKGLLFAACSLGVAAVNLPVILSVGKALSETLAVTKPAPTALKLYHPLLEVLKRMLPGMGRSLEFGPPNIYFGLLTLVFTGITLFRRTVPLRMKIFFGALAAFFLLSFNLNVLDYAWHGFHFPNQLPARQSFLFIFIMLVAAVPGTEIAEGFFKRKRFLQVLLSVLIMAELMINAGV